MRLSGRVQSGKGDAARWLALFNIAYSRKTGMPVFPGSLNVALDAPFDWFAPAVEERTIWFGREEYGGEREIVPVRAHQLERRTSDVVDANHGGTQATKQVQCDSFLRSRPAMDWKSADTSSSD